MRQRRAHAPEPAARPGTKHDETTITPNDFDDMMRGPIPGYEEVLRMCVRRLTDALESDDTSARDLAPISRSLLQASKELDAIRNDDQETTPITNTDDTYNPIDI